MTAFFQFLLIIFLTIVFMIGIFVYRVYRQIHDATKHFKQQMGGEQGSRTNQSRRGQTHYGDDEMVIDQRDPDEANRKIFTEKDGEYVDYKEEKDAEKQ